jgi:protein-L-isoaspartate(D-aspartate) O-methyltransferase
VDRDLTRARQRMIERHLAGRDITDPAVLAAMDAVPREAFVEPGQRGEAYADRPLPIGFGQTISQPYIVALMAQLLELAPTDRVLEVGSGCGYAAAVLSQLAAEVFAIEVVGPLAEASAQRLARLGYDHVRVRVGDGTLGWPEAAPFDAILVSAAAPTAPPSLVAQLAPAGRLVLPIGPSGGLQRLLRLRRGAGGAPDRREDLGPVAFVPLLGEEGW